jgi:hypothetical protein
VLLPHISGHPARLAARHLVEPHADRPQKVTSADDKGFETREFVAQLRTINVTPPVAQFTKGRDSAIDGRTTRHRGLPMVGWQFTLARATYNLVRLPKLLMLAASRPKSVQGVPAGWKSRCSMTAFRQPARSLSENGLRLL